MMRCKLVSYICWTLWSAIYGTSPIAAADWPDFLGPGRRSVSPEVGLQLDWPTQGPPLVWSVRLGTGYGIGTVAKGRFYQFDRLGNKARLRTLDAKTGEQIWEFTYPTQYEDLLGYNNGPRCSPVIDDQRIYLFGAEGMLYCLSCEDGSVLWEVDTVERYGVVQNFFGVGSTPLVEGELLIVNMGGSPPNSPETYSGRVQGNGTGIVAFNKRNGLEQYRLTDELASYASPIAATIEGRRWCFVFARGGLVAFEPASGKIEFLYPWRATLLESVNASTPTVFGNRILITEAYQLGSSLLAVRPGGYDVIWTDKSLPRRRKSMMAHWNTPVYVDGFIYGSSGRHRGEAELRCIEANTGEVQWSRPGLTRSSLLAVDGHLIALSEDGALRVVKADPTRCEIVSEVRLRTATGTALLAEPAWSAPIVANGRLYVRGRDMLACLDLRATSDATAP